MHGLPRVSGPRLFSRGYAQLAAKAQTNESLFQWGHDFSAVDTCDGLRGSDLDSHVSMGPRLFSRGYYGPWVKGAPSSERFRWGHRFSAVDTSTMIKILKALGLSFQWGHGFSAANTRASLTVHQVREFRFNGAMAFQPWILVVVILVIVEVFGVSMGPWLFSRGYRTGTVTSRPTAATFQWGHGFSAVDTSRRQEFAASGRRVSIGPWLFSRG